MDDTCVIRGSGTPESDGVLDPDTGEIVYPPAAVLYDGTSTGEDGRALGGRCKIRPMQSGVPQDVEWGGTDTPLEYNLLSLPHDAPEVPTSSVVEMSTSRRDAQLPGRRYVVRDVVHTTMLVQRRLIVEDLR